MQYAHVTDGVVDYRGVLPKNWGNTSNVQMADPATLKAMGWVPLTIQEAVMGPDDTNDGFEDIVTADGVTTVMKSRPLTAEEIADRERDIVQQEINRLEEEVTPRRTREAILGTDDGWLANQDALIAAERAKLSA
tara:strand:+ start:47 stop:451 length:405 start_codon:yes stop_codon:yes gene_type:complete